MTSDPGAGAAGSSTASSPEADSTRDGRHRRWDAHRDQRRAELTDAVVRAIREHGPGIGMEEMAQAAGTSKAVLYRHFGDKRGVHRAVTEVASESIRASVARALSRPEASQGHPGRQATRAVIDGYLSLVERDPAVYRFVISGPHSWSGSDPVRSLADQVGRQLGEHLASAGVSEQDAAVWGPALVGLIRAAADDWMARTDRSSQDDLVESLTRLAWYGLRTPPRSGVP